MAEPATTSAWLLIVWMASTSSLAVTQSWHEFPEGMKACRESVAAARTDQAQGGDAEGAMLMVCLPKRDYELEHRLIGAGPKDPPQPPVKRGAAP